MTQLKLLKSQVLHAPDDGVQSVGGPSRPQEYNPVPPATNVDNASDTVDGPGHCRPAQKIVCDDLESVKKKIDDFHIVK